MLFIRRAVFFLDQVLGIEPTLVALGSYSSTNELHRRSSKRKESMKPGAPAKPPAIRIWKETAHRGGKGVSAINGIPLPQAQLEEICSALKKKCGTGGTVKNGVIEIQGDHRDRLVEELKKLGFTDVKKAGG